VTGALLLHHDPHVPDDVRVFAVPASAIRRWAERARVYDLRVGNLVLRHYAFWDRWFAVNCTLDLDGRFVAEPGPPPWSFNRAIVTPPLQDGDAVYGVDLAPDVLVAPDGQRRAIVDEEEYAEAARNGWCTVAEQRGARDGRSDLLAIIGGDGLGPCFDAIRPFGPVADAPARRPMTSRRLAEVPPLRATNRNRGPSPA
jgi:hypothetical protein